MPLRQTHSHIISNNANPGEERPGIGDKKASTYCLFIQGLYKLIPGCVSTSYQNKLSQAMLLGEAAYRIRYLVQILRHKQHGVSIIYSQYVTKHICSYVREKSQNQKTTEAKITIFATVNPSFDSDQEKVFSFAIVNGLLEISNCYFQNSFFINQSNFL